MPTCSRITLIPGPQGPPGTSASSGTNGANAYTLTSAAFTMPAEQANVTVGVLDSAWMVALQNVFVGIGGAVGTFQVVSKPTATSVILKNLEDTASSLYTSNSPPGTVFASGAGVSPGSVQGPTGAVPAGALLAANNLSDVASVATSRTNLGLGTMAVQNATTVAVTGGTITGITDLAVADGGTGSSTAAAARTALGLGTIATQDAGAVAITGGAITGITDLTVADGGTGASTAANARTNLGIVIGTDVQAFDATLAALAAANWAANALPIGTGADTLAQTAFAASTFPARSSAGNLVAKTITDTGLAFLTSANVVAWNDGAGSVFPRYGLFSALASVDLNAGGTDVTMPVNDWASNTRYRIDKIMLENASTSITTATVGVFTAAGGGGTTIAANQAISGLTSSSKWIALTLEAIVGTDVMTASPLYFRVGTPQGGAATVRVHLFGWSFSS